MTKKRRFFIFLSSAGIMTCFLLFTLSMREDKPLETLFEWTPNARVIKDVLVYSDAQGNTYNKVFKVADSVNCKLKELNVTELEIRKALQEGDVEFNNDLTEARNKDRQYYISAELYDKEYFVVVQITKGYSYFIDFGQVNGDKLSCSN